MRDHVMKQMDTDSDHRISLAEFLAVCFIIFQTFCKEEKLITFFICVIDVLDLNNFRIERRRRKSRIKVGKILGTKNSIPKKN